MRIWRAGDLLLPTRATSSCHRCRSRAGWRDRQVLSGCKNTLITPLSHIKANTFAISTILRAALSRGCWQAWRERLAPPSRLQLVRTAVTTLLNRVITGARHGSDPRRTSVRVRMPSCTARCLRDCHRPTYARAYVLLLKRHRLGELYHWLCKPSERRVPCRIGRTQDSATSQI